jgi:hypothetical protein
MSTTLYRNRRAVRLENETLRLTALIEGGHIAEILHKPTGVNPLWTPPWPSLEPSEYDPVRHPGYGGNAESRLLAGLMGHNLCMDIFGGPSAEEAEAGMTVHGEASIVTYETAVEQGILVQRAQLPQAQLRFQRTLAFEGTSTIRISEAVENLSALDRPIAWTQHVTLGAPFVEPGLTQFRVSATRSKTAGAEFTDGKGYLKPDEEFEWPYAPGLNGGRVDMRAFVDLPVSGGFTTHLMDPKRERAFFLAWSPASRLLIGYSWRRADFPWLGIWEENRLRTAPPWNGKTITRGMEFGVSPWPETRRRMIERGSQFGVPTYRWIPARKSVLVDYEVVVYTAETPPEEL